MIGTVLTCLTALFAHSRDVGPFGGLVPGRRQSGEQDPHLGITKCGDRYVRKLLVQCAHIVMGRFGSDCALRRWALAHAQHAARQACGDVAPLVAQPRVFKPFPVAAQDGR